MYIFSSKVIIQTLTNCRQIGLNRFIRAHKSILKPKPRSNYTEWKNPETSLSGHSPVSDMEVYVDLKNVSKLLPAVLDRVTEINWLGNFQGLMQKHTAKQYCFPSMLDIGRFHSLDLISYMPYKRESMDFWIIFSKISKGKGISFLHAYTGKGAGRSGACITPEECKINFTIVYSVAKIYCSHEFSDTMTGHVILAVFTETNILVPHF